MDLLINEGRKEGRKEGRGNASEAEFGVNERRTIPVVCVLFILEEDVSRAGDSMCVCVASHWWILYPHAYDRYP